MVPYLEYLILGALMLERNYGFALTEVIQVQFNETISAGSLYPTLNRLFKNGYVEWEWGDASEVTEGARRKYYKITGKGVTAYQETWAKYNRAHITNPQPAPG